MNIPELQQIRTRTERGSDTSDKETICCIEYLNQHFYKNLRDSIIAQIASYEQLPIKTKSTYERNARERRILILKLILELLEY
jgi:hypothetical protein